jgi:hypothetical protein
MGGMHDRTLEVRIPERPWLYDRYYTFELRRRPSWPWKMLIWTHVLAICAGLLLAAVLYSFVRWDGHAFYSVGNRISVPAHVGDAVTFSVVLENLGDAPIVLERVALADATAGMRIVGVRGGRPGESPGNGFAWQGPSSGVRGVVVSPGTAGEKFVVLGLRAERPGTYMSRGIRVWYRAGPTLPVLGRGGFTQTTGEEMVMRVTN